MDYKYLQASNGVGNAIVMRVANARATGSPNIAVDDITGCPANFIGTYGTLNAKGYIDIKTKQDFYGHLSVLNIPLKLCGAGSDVSNGSYTWSNPGNITADDNTFAVVSTTGTQTDATHYLRASSFGFSVPTGATIVGIQVSVDRKASQQFGLNSCHDDVIRLVHGSGTPGTANKADTSSNWPTTKAAAVYGGATDLWGETWTPADVNNTNFGAEVAARLNTSGSFSASVDSISIAIYYTAAGSNLVIEGFLPGSIDGGNAENQVVIIKPSTPWANKVAQFIINATGFGTPEPWTVDDVTAGDIVANSITLQGSIILDGVVDATYRYTVITGDITNCYVLVSFAHGLAYIPKVLGAWIQGGVNKRYPLPLNYVAAQDYTGEPMSLIATIKSVDATNINVAISFHDAFAISLLVSQNLMEFQFHCVPFDSTL